MFAVAGLILNWGGTETAAVFGWHEQGANKVKKELALRLGNNIELKCGNSVDTLTCVNWFKPVGTRTAVNADMGKEVSRRCASTVAVARPLAVMILRKPLLARGTYFKVELGRRSSEQSTALHAKIHPRHRLHRRRHAIQ